MSEQRAVYDSTADLPEPVRPALRLIDTTDDAAAAQILLQCVASSVDPDCCFSAAIVGTLPADFRDSAVKLIAYGWTVGFTPEQQRVLSSWCRQRCLHFRNGRYTC